MSSFHQQYHRMELVGELLRSPMNPIWLEDVTIVISEITPLKVVIAPVANATPFVVVLNFNSIYSLLGRDPSSTRLGFLKGNNSELG